jgi:small-conductance mechanosensitive channel
LVNIEILSGALSVHWRTDAKNDKVAWRRSSLWIAYFKMVGVVAYIKQAAVVLLGLLLLGLVVLGWGLATGSITTKPQPNRCWGAGYGEDCHFRGASTFLMWCVIGLVNILIIGFLLDRITRK